MIWKAIKKLAFFTFAMALVLIVSTGVSKAATVDDLTFKLNSDGQSYSVTGCKAYASGELVIPATYNGKPVTTIGNSAFSWCSSLTSITIPDSVTTIGAEAFYYCYSLTAVTIGNSVTTIGDYAFRGCESLTAVTIPDSVTTIGAEAFDSCESLTSVTIGNSVTTIGYSAFSGCESLTGIWVDEDNPNYSSDVTGVLFDKDQKELIQAPGGLSGGYDIPDSVTTIGDYAFYNCTSLTSVTIPDSVTTIGYRAFSSCDSLTAVTIPDSVTTIGEEAFRNCTRLTAVTIGNSVTTIGYMAFYNCSGLTSITIPDSVTTIGNCAFENCTSLTSVTIGNSVTTIGNFAFHSCYRLTSVTIPDSVTTIGNSAFIGCESLTSVTIGNSVTTIGYRAFQNCTSLTAVTIPDSVTTIGDYAFSGCDSLTEIVFTGDAPEIGRDAFFSVPTTAYYPAENDTWTEEVRQSYGGTITWVEKEEETDSPLTFTLNDDGESYSVTGCDESASGEIVIPATYKGKPVTAIGDSAFSDCYSLISVTIPDSVTTIGDYAFANCESLISAAIPDSTVAIGSYVFGWCRGLESISIGNGVTTIPEFAFFHCTSLTSLSIGNSVTTIGEAAFYDCASLTTITIPQSVTNIDYTALEDCASLTEIWVDADNASYSSDENGVLYNKDKTKLIKVPVKLTGEYFVRDGVITIGAWALSRCSGLTAVTIPNSVTTIGDNAFYLCYNLTEITFGSGIGTIEYYAFAWCEGLTKIVFTGDAPRIGEYAFGEAVTDVYYPADNSTWTEDVCQNYGGTLNWIAYTSKEPISITIPGVEGTFASFADAIAAYDPATQYIKLTGDVAVDLTLAKDLKIDLNGFSLSGVIDLNGNAVYGVDNSTDGYTCEAIGYFNCVDEKGEPVVPAAQFKTDKATYGAVKRYLAVQDENGWSFHRFYFGITHATLNTSNGGIGYKAAFAGDEMVKAALGVNGAYGIELAVNEDFSACVTTRFAAFEFPNAGVAQTRTLLLQNILASGMSLEEMSANAAMPVYARTFLKLEDGTEIYSSVFQISLKELVQAADKNFANLTSGQQLHLKAFYATYADLFKDWELENI